MTRVANAQKYLGSNNSVCVKYRHLWMVVGEEFGIPPVPQATLIFQNTKKGSTRNKKQYTQAS